MSLVPRNANKLHLLHMDTIMTINFVSSLFIFNNSKICVIKQNFFNSSKNMSLIKINRLVGM